MGNSIANCQTTLFSENFESITSNTKIPTSGANVWIQNVKTGFENQWWGLSGTGTVRTSFYSGTKALGISKNIPATSGTRPQYINLNSSTTYAYKNTLINAVGYENITLNFKYICGGESGYDYGQVAYSTDGTNWTDLGTQYQGTSTTAPAMVSVTNLDLSVLNGTQFYIGFKWTCDNSIGGNPAFVIDDISVTGTEICSPAITSLGSTSGCLGSSLTINGTCLSDATAVTIGGTSASITGNTETAITVTVGNGTTGTVEVTTPNGVATSVSVFTVNSPPSVSAGNDMVFTTGNSVIIGGYPTATGGTPPYTYSWSPSITLNASDIANPTATPTVATVYTVTVTDDDGCTNSDAMTCVQPWYDENWTYRKVITIDHTKVSNGPHSNFPMLVSITDTDLQSKALSNGNDIFFTTSTGIQLNHEIEKYDNATGLLVAWVSIPSLPSDVNTEIYMYYGNAASSNQQNINDTWNTNYIGVWHLNTVFTDATSNGNNGTNTGTTTTTGMMAGGSNFDPSDGDDYITINGLMGSPTNVTLSGWGNLDSRDVTGSHLINIGDYTSINVDDVTDGYLGAYYNGGWGLTKSSPKLNPAGSGWHYFVYTFNDDLNTQVLYMDGLEVGSGAYANCISYSGQGTNTFIGKHGYGSSNFDFDGIIDEVRVSNSIRSAGWVLTEYNNQYSPSTFYTVGSEARIFYSLESGDWSNPATWSNTGYSGTTATATPNLSGDYVVIGNNRIVTLDENVSNVSVVIESTGTLNMEANTISNQGYFSLNSGANLSIGSVNGITSSGAIGNIQVTGTRTFSQTGNYIYNGTAEQVTGNGLPSTVNNLTINNSAGVSLTNNIDVTGTLTLTSGILTTGANTIDLGTTGSISEITPSSTAPTSYVTGTVKATRTLMQNANNTFGNIGIEILETNIASNPTEVIRITGIGCTGNEHIGALRYFTITPTTDIGLNATMIMHYFDHEIISLTETNLKIFKSSDNQVSWDEQPSILDAANNNLTLTGITSFSDWTASDYLNENLPIELLDFVAIASHDSVNLLWSTASETNNNYFTIERSIDGQQWDKIETIPGSGNSTNYNEYEYNYKDLFQGIVYYRLMQTDFDGTNSYSKIIAINLDYMFDTIVKILYNETEKYISITCDNPSEKSFKTIEILSITGQKMYKSNNFINLIESSFLEKGIYYVYCEFENSITIQKILIY